MLTAEQPKWSGFPRSRQSPVFKALLLLNFTSRGQSFPIGEPLIEGSGSNRFSRGEVNEVYRAMLTVLSRGVDSGQCRKYPLLQEKCPSLYEYYLKLVRVRRLKEKMMA